MRNQNTFIKILSWFMPSGSEVVFSTGLSFLTLALSNATFFRSVIFLPTNFEFKTAVLDSINNLIVSVVGDDIARSGVVAIFWAIVGLVVYVLIWLGINFSGELGNDLALTKYVHPRNVDTHSPLRDLLSRISFQIVALCVFIFYVNLMISVLLPYIGGLFHTTITQWPGSSAIRYGLTGVVSEIVVLHLFVVLVRALTLRKRVLG